MNFAIKWEPLKKNIRICFINSYTWEVLIETDKINYDGFLNIASFQSFEESKWFCVQNIKTFLGILKLCDELIDFNEAKSISFVKHSKCVAKKLQLILILGHNVLQTPA